MKTPKKSYDLIRQNEQVVKKSQKHDTNLQKNSVLFFQVGLIVCLLAAYGLLEMTFVKSNEIVSAPPPIDRTIYDMSDDRFIPESPKMPEPITIAKSAKKSLEPEVVPDDVPISPFGDVPQPSVINNPISPGDVKVTILPEEIPVSFDFVEEVPIYPGCENEKTNDARRKCMSDKITKLVQKQFDSNLAGELGLSGKQVIRTQFKIDKMGYVSDIQVRASHSKLKEETERVIKKIPEMTPGKQQNINVGVIYSLPIVFQVQD